MQGSENAYITKKLKERLDELSKKFEANLIEIKTILIILLIALPSILIIEIRFKLITKCVFGKCRKGYDILRFQTFRAGEFKRMDEYFVRSRKDCEIEKRLETLEMHLNSLLDKRLKDKLDDFDETLNWRFNNKLNDIVKKMESNSNVKNCKIIKFQIDDENELIEIGVANNDNIVNIKRQICNRWSQAKPFTYKVMRLFYLGEVLDDNKYLLDLVQSENLVVNCKIESINPNEIVVINVQGEPSLPDLIQMNTNRTIKDLKSIILKFSDIKDLIIFHDKKQLEDDLTIKSYNLSDNSLIKVVQRKHGKLVLKSVFEENESLVVEYSNFDKISSIKQKAANKFNADSESFIFFLNEKVLEDDKCIYEYDLDEGSSITFYCLMRFIDIAIENSQISEGPGALLQKGTFNSSKKTISILKYKFSIDELLKERFLLDQLKIVQITKRSERFIHLLGIYKDENLFYEVMEYMDGESLPMFVENIKNKTEEHIPKWAVQIMEGFKCLHKYNIYFHKFNPYDIFLDEKRNIKLLNPSLYKYSSTNKRWSESLMMYVAPEDRERRSLNEKADVWSLGAVLIYILTRRHPTTAKIINKKPKFEVPKDTSRELRLFLDSCMRFDPVERLSLEKLEKYKFIENISY